MLFHTYRFNTLTKELSFTNSGLYFVNKVRGCRRPSCGTIMNVREKNARMSMFMSLGLRNLANGLILASLKLILRMTSLMGLSQDSLQSKCMPRYLTDSLVSRYFPLNLTLPLEHCLRLCGLEKNIVSHFLTLGVSLLRVNKHQFHQVHFLCY